MKRWFGGIVISVLLSSSALAVDCATMPDRTPGLFWRYRIIDEKPCWYRGDAALPKSDLIWTPAEPAKVQEQFAGPAPLAPIQVKTISYRMADIEPANVGRDHAVNAIADMIVLLGFCAVIGCMFWPICRSSPKSPRNSSAPPSIGEIP